MPKLQVTFSEVEAAFIDAMCRALGVTSSAFVGGIVRQALREMMRDGELARWEQFKQQNFEPDEETPED